MRSRSVGLVVVVAVVVLLAPVATPARTSKACGMKLGPYTSVLASGPRALAVRHTERPGGVDSRAVTRHYVCERRRGARRRPVLTEDPQRLGVPHEYEQSPVVVRGRRVLLPTVRGNLTDERSRTEYALESFDARTGRRVARRVLAVHADGQGTLLAAHAVGRRGTVAWMRRVLHEGLDEIVVDGEVVLRHHSIAWEGLRSDGRVHWGTADGDQGSARLP